MARREDGDHIGLNDENGAAIPVDDNDPKRQVPAEQRRAAPRRQRVQHARRPRRHDMRMVAARNGKLREMQDIHGICR